MRTKKIVPAVATLCALMLLVMMAGCAEISPQWQPKWEGLYDLSPYEKMLGEPILEISLLKSANATEWVTFSDDDLIKTWETTLNDMEVRAALDSEVSSSETNDNVSIVELTTEQSTFVLNLRVTTEGYLLEKYGKSYVIKNPGAIPFEESYDTAVMRHGVQTQSLEWEKLTDLSAYSELAGSPILEITLALELTSPEWVVFSDEDMVQTWTDVLNLLEVRSTGRHVEDRSGITGGGPAVITIKTETSTFSLYVAGPKLLIDGYYYEMKEPDMIPLEETYHMMRELYGVKTPWD